MPLIDLPNGPPLGFPKPPKKSPMQPSIDEMRPNLLWRDPNFNPVQPPSSVLAPWWPTADRVSDWFTGPPGSPQAVDDPAYQRRLEGTIPLPGVRQATPREAQNAMLRQNMPQWLHWLFGEDIAPTPAAPLTQPP